MNHVGGWLVAITLTCSVSVTRANDDPVIQRMRDCGTEMDHAKRLACYDSAIGRTETSDDVGLTGKLLRKRQQGKFAATAPKSVRAKVVAITRPPTGKFVVTLDNGQVWSQQEVLDFPLEVSDEVTIRPGLLGALWLVDEHRKNRETRVTRVR